MWSVGISTVQGVVGISSRWSGMGVEPLPEVRKWSGDSPGGPELVGRPSLRSGSGREVLPQLREYYEGPPGGPKLVGRPSQRFGSGC